MVMPPARRTVLDGKRFEPCCDEGRRRGTGTRRPIIAAIAPIDAHGCPQGLPKRSDRPALEQDQQRQQPGGARGRGALRYRSSKRVSALWRTRQAQCEGDQGPTLRPPDRRGPQAASNASSIAEAAAIRTSAETDPIEMMKKIVATTCGAVIADPAGRFRARPNTYGCRGRNRVRANTLRIAAAGLGRGSAFRHHDVA